MQKSIVVEGPDGTGKSTLAAKLAEDLGFPLCHTGGRSPDQSVLIARCVEIAVKAKAAPTVFDRVPHISDNIYREAFGDSFLLPDATMSFLLGHLPVVLVFCQSAPDMSEAPKDHKPPEHMAQVKEARPAIIRGYARRAEETNRQGVPTFLFDWRLDSYESLLERIKACVG